jgi:hypothetical protein
MPLFSRLKGVFNSEEHTSNIFIATGLSLFVAAIWFGSFHHNAILYWLSENILFHGWLIGWLVLVVAVVPLIILKRGFSCCREESAEHHEQSFKGARHVSSFAGVLGWIDALGKNSSRRGRR